MKNPSDPVVHKLAWRVVCAYRQWFLAPAGRESARAELRDAVARWVEVGMPLIQGESDGGVPPYVRERAGLPPVEKS